MSSKNIMNLILMFFCMFFLLNQIRSIPDNSLNNFTWISIAFNIIILILLARYNYNIKLPYVKKIIIIVIICAFYFSIGTWVLDYNMHGYIKNDDKINLYVEYENVSKLPLEVCKVITIGKENSNESKIDLEKEGNIYIINSYFREDQIKKGDSVSYMIVFKMFKIIPFVKITKVTYRG